MSALFGPAGQPPEFYEMGYKASVDMPKWLRETGLDAYEYQCGHGVAIKEAGANALKQAAKENHIILSLHAPYYINPATPDPEKRERALSHVEKSILAAQAMGAGRIVIHTGALLKQTRQEALFRAQDFFHDALSLLDKHHINDIYLCPETMGKINQLGTFSEVMYLCQKEERLLPAIDFGHINARTQGSLVIKEDYDHLLLEMEQTIGLERSRIFHAHFSHIEYTAGGEKRHLTFADTTYGPFFEPLCQAIVCRDWSPTIICESDGTQGIDARTMKKQYKEAIK